MKTKADRDFAEALALFYALMAGIMLGVYLGHRWLEWF